jgi:nicotinamidase/pyrazinamidase
MKPVNPHDALIVVDVQNCFCPGGSLGVPEGDRVVSVVNRMLSLFSHRAFTRDWHPPDHVSFTEAPEFKDMSWPPHCVQNTAGAEFHPDLEVPPDALVVSKGDDPGSEAYSGFQSTTQDLAGWLRERQIERVFVTGLATDYCVRATSLDAKKAGFEVVLVEDAARGVAPDTTEKALEELQQAGVHRATSDEVVASAGQRPDGGSAESVTA